jgi:Flp pilus assembly protein TadD
MKTKSVLITAAFAALLILTTMQAQTAAPLDDARAALKANDLAGAESLLLPLTGAEAKDAAAFHALGQLRERQRNLKEAVAAYEQATRLDATQPEYFSALGIALSQRMGEMNFMQQAMVAGKMKKAFEKSVELDPKHLAGLIGLARYYTNAPEIAGGSLEKAKEFAARIAALVPFLGETEFGNIAEKGEDFAGALVRYEAALRSRPDDAGLLLACGRNLARLGRKDEARARFEAALRLNPNLESAKKALAGLDAPAEAKG